MEIKYFPADKTIICDLYDFRNENQEKKPVVRWCTYDGIDSHGECCVTQYTLKDFSLYNGMQAENFKSTDWKKLPKGWSYNTPLVDDIKTFDKECYDKWLIFGKSIEGGIKNKNALMEAIKRGFMVKDDGRYFSVESEIVNKQYRLIRKLSEKGYRPIYRVSKENLYDTFEDAENASKAMIAEIEDNIKKQIIVDRLDDIQYFVKKAPEEYRERVRFVLECLPIRYGDMIRFYEGELLYKKYKSNIWDVIYKCQ